MKKIATLVILLCCFFINTIASASIILEYDGGVHNYTGSVYALSVNGRKLSNLPLEPIIFNDRALVPVREVFEAMDADVIYNPGNKTIEVIYGETTVWLQIGSTTAKINNKPCEIPDKVAPRLIARWGESAKTMVPVRFISENIGLNVEFDSDEGLISISEENKPQAPSVTNTLNKITCSTDEDNVVTIKVTGSGTISAITKAAMTTSGTIYTDVSNTKYSLNNSISVDEGAVTTVRFGQHDTSTRIAVDTEGVKKYSVYLSSDKKTVVFKITSDDDVVLSPNPSATIKPSTSPSVKPGTTTSPTPTPTPRPQIIPNSKKIVILDAGHGGSDPGAVGNLMTDSELEAYYEALESTELILSTMAPGTGTLQKEKDIALSVTKKVQKILESEGVEVIMTRTGDTYPSLDARPELANNKAAVIFTSIHVNSTAYDVTAANGIEVYYSQQNNDKFYGIKSSELAESVLDNVITETKAKSRGVKTADYLVIRKSLMPAVLVEIGFINNPVELAQLIDDSYQNKLARGIAEGILGKHSKIDLSKK